MAMPKHRRKPRWKATVDDSRAYIPLVPRITPGTVTIDSSRKLSPDELSQLLRLHGVEPQQWMLDLEGRIGGMRFGEHYHEVWLGFRSAFHTYFRTGSPARLEETEDGETLLRIGVEGDTLYYLSLDGQAWVQDGIADRWPHWETHTFDELAARLNWPEKTQAR